MTKRNGNTDTPISFGKYLKAYRKARDLTQAELAELVGYSLESIRKIESDQHRPSKYLAERLADKLALSPDEASAFIRLARLLPTEPILPLPPPVSNNLPTQPTSFIGHEKEISEIKRLVSEVRWVAKISTMAITVAVTVLALVAGLFLKARLSEERAETVAQTFPTTLPQSEESNQTLLSPWNGEGRQPILSPSGSKIAYISMWNNQATLWIRNSDGTNPIQLTLSGSNDSPAWSWDGSKIAFQSDAQDWWEVWAANADGSNPQRLTTSAAGAGNPSWAPDGSKLVYTYEPSTMVHDLYTVNSNGTRQTLLLSASATGYSNHQPAWSPDGTQIATIHYPAGSTNGSFSLWLMNANGSNGQVLVQNIDHPNLNNLSWSTDGNWIVFSKSGQLWRVKREGTGLTQITTTGTQRQHPNSSQHLFDCLHDESFSFCTQDQ